MTKQELLDKYIPCECWPVKDGGKRIYNVSCPQHAQDPETAMDEWAEHQVEEFQKWTNLNGWFWVPNKWINYHGDNTKLSTKELYNQFLQSIQP